jgi:hypothetical protein
MQRSPNPGLQVDTYFTNLHRPLSAVHRRLLSRMLKAAAEIHMCTPPAWAPGGSGVRLSSYLETIRGKLRQGCPVLGEIACAFPHQGGARESQSQPAELVH